MNKILKPGFIILFLVLFSFTTIHAQYLTYEIDITKYKDDLFHVTFYPGNLTAEQDTFKMPAYVPGTYSVMDFGRFVKSISAYDDKGKEIPCEKISINDWKISEPESVFKIEYKCEDTFDAGIEENLIFPMAATGIENDYIVLNTFGVCGYFESVKAVPVRIGLYYNSLWEVGTALDKNDDGYYYAESYYHLADSPFLIGELDETSMKVGDIDVDIYVFAKSEAITADTISTLVNDVLTSSEKFLSFAPVNRYAFLMVFIDLESMQRNKIFGMGALEHSYSSLHVLFDAPQVLNGLPGIIGHEFMHILTPLHLHSQYIADYDFSKPSTEDLHIWLYEGTTEWVSDIMLLRSGYYNLTKFLRELSTKLSMADNYRKDLSLVDLSTGWDKPDIGSNFVNFYNRGAATAALLDIKLLELSNGKKGLREVYFDLIKKYGKEKPFESTKLFDEIVEMTYPEIRGFIERYIKQTEPLPVKEYFEKLGINYIEVRQKEMPEAMLGLSLTSPDGKRISIQGISDEHKPFGLQVGDIVLKIFGEEVNLETGFALLSRIKAMSPGDKYDITILRGEEEIELTGELVEKRDKHIFEIDENATEEQLALRNAWMTNLHEN